jgi:hypothetical protein
MKWVVKKRIAEFFIMSFIITCCDSNKRQGRINLVAWFKARCTWNDIKKFPVNMLKILKVVCLIFENKRLEVMWNKQSSWVSGWVEELVNIFRINILSLLWKLISVVAVNTSLLTCE